MSIHYHHLPHPELTAFVDGYCLTENDEPSPISTGERYLPAGKMELNILLGGGMIREYDRHHDRHDTFEDFQSGELSGVNSKFAIGDTANLVSLIKVLFKPYGARALLPFPASEVCDLPVSLETVWGATANDLCEQLQAAKTPQRKFHILDQFLLARLDEDQAPHPAVLYAVKKFQSTQAKRPVSQLTECLGLSPKRFIHLFRETVGLTPKLYYRIQRFQQVLNRMEGEQDPLQWADVATRYGYFDQAHLIHDFQTFSGSTPEAYHKPKRERHPTAQGEAPQRRARKISLLEGARGLNAYGYPEVCRKSLNSEVLQGSPASSHVSLLD